MSVYNSAGMVFSESWPIDIKRFLQDNFASDYEEIFISPLQLRLKDKWVFNFSLHFQFIF